jgi:hypothetical protein
MLKVRPYIRTFTAEVGSDILADDRTTTRVYTWNHMRSKNQAYYNNELKIRDALVPPKPKLFVMATERSSFLVASWTC